MTPILGKSVATAEQMAAYLLSKNPNPKIDIELLLFCRLYLLVGALEGVRGDLAFAQTCKETGNLSFPGTVTPDQKNYAGLGTTSTTVKGAYFPDEATGILAQMQHLKAYDGTPLNYECVDPRYEVLAGLGRLGTAKNWEELGGKWAVPGYSTKKYNSLAEANAAKDSYGYNVLDILGKILAMPGGNENESVKEEVKEEEKAPAEESVKEEKSLKGIRICIDAGHYRDYNKCPANPAYAEARVMWKLHLLQKQYLEELGAEVVLTRSNQELDLSLSARGKASKGCDAFISNHSNAVGSYMNENVDYVAIYHLTEDAYATCDDISKELANVLAPVIAEVMGTKQGYKVLTRKASNDKNGDGVLNDNYYGVLNGARSVDVPGMILEHSFHTNMKIVNWLLDDNNLDMLARAEAEAIAKYFSGKDIEIGTGTTSAGPNSVPYTIKVANVAVDDVLYIRKEPNYKSDATGQLAYNDPNRYTIVEERNGWGRLKSGIGWINLKYTVRV